MHLQDGKRKRTLGQQPCLAPAREAELKINWEKVKTVIRLAPQRLVGRRWLKKPAFYYCFASEAMARRGRVRLGDHGAKPKKGAPSKRDETRLKPKQGPSGAAKKARQDLGSPGSMIKRCRRWTESRPGHFVKRTTY